MRSSRIVPVGLGEELESSLDAHDGDGEVREAGEVARQMAGTHPAAVFVIGDVAHVVQPIFDAPMPSHEREDELGGGLFGGKRGQAVHGLVLDLAGLGASPLAFDAKRHRAMGQRGLVGVVGEIEHPAASVLDASVSLVCGSVLGGAHLGALPVEPGEVDEQVGLVGFDRGHHVVRAARLDHAPGGFVLHMHRVHGHDPAFEIEPQGQGPNGRDLVALASDRFLPEHLPGVMLHGCDEVVVAGGVVAGGAADALAVDGHRFVAAVLLRGPSARGAVQHIGVERDQDVEERGRGGRGETSQTVAVEGSKGAKLVLGQCAGKLRERSGAMVSGELRGHRDGQDRGQRVAPPACAAELGYGAKTLEQASQPARRPRLGVALASPRRRVVQGAKLLARIARQRVDQDLLRSPVRDPGRGRAGLAGKALGCPSTCQFAAR